LRNECAVATEFDDAVVEIVADVNVTLDIKVKSMWIHELAFTGAFSAPTADKNAVLSEFLDAAVA